MRMTTRQEVELQRLITQARDAYGVEVRGINDLDITYLGDEVRPGRGVSIRFSFVDCDHAVAGSCDVYGNGSHLFVAELFEVHNSANEECGCGPCDPFRQHSEPSVLGRSVETVELPA